MLTRYIDKADDLYKLAPNITFAWDGLENVVGELGGVVVDLHLKT